MRICCVNTFVSCGNFIRAKKIWASTVFLCIYFLHLVCTCIFLFSGYLSVYPDHYMKFYRVWSCLTAEPFCFTECFVGAYGLTWMSSHGEILESIKLAH